jgi:D-sedoheptulose 7-phosphate isomerase
MKPSGDFQGRIGKSIRTSIDAQQSLLSDSKTIAEIASVCHAIVTAFKHGNKLLLFGNGGSAADAQHIAAEFVGRFAFDRAALPAIYGSRLTTIGNDYGFEQVFQGSPLIFCKDWRRRREWGCGRSRWRDKPALNSGALKT